MFEDQGWGAAWRALFARGEGGGLSPLELQRVIFTGFIAGFALLLMTLWLIQPEPGGSISVPGAVVIVATAALVAYGAIGLIRNRGAAVTGELEAIGRYRTLMFILIAFAESPVLIGFVLGFAAGSVTPYLVALAASIPALVLAAPTRASVEHFQDRYGGAIDVFAALTTPPGPPG